MTVTRDVARHGPYRVCSVRDNGSLMYVVVDREGSKAGFRPGLDALRALRHAAVRLAQQTIFASYGPGADTNEDAA